MLELRRILEDAIALKATDIHFSCMNKDNKIRFRIHDELIDYQSIPKEVYERLLIWIKYKSNLNLNNSKTPQSSAFNFKMGNQELRIRISTLSSFNQDSLVLRLSYYQKDQTIDSLLLIKEQGQPLLQAFNQRNGLIIMTGPTGSGKTTLSYSLLNYIKENKLAIVTIEDPIERFHDGFVQLQINESAGINYEVGVKEILRHDPDLIFIGEIRDAYSAKAAIRASLTGHLVISTMHATSALKALYRLLEFGITFTECEQTIVLITNQRLVYLEKDKKIIYEYLDQPLIQQGLEQLKNQQPFHYPTISDYLKNYPEYQVIK